MMIDAIVGHVLQNQTLPLEFRFNVAAKIVSGVMRDTTIPVNTQDKGDFYSLLPIAMGLKITDRFPKGRPGMISFIERGKYDAWFAIKDKTSPEAMEEYIELTIGVINGREDELTENLTLVQKRKLLIDTSLRTTRNTDGTVKKLGTFDAQQPVFTVEEFGKQKSAQNASKAMALPAAGTSAAAPKAAAKTETLASLLQQCPTFMKAYGEAQSKQMAAHATAAAAQPVFVVQYPAAVQHPTTVRFGSYAPTAPSASQAFVAAAANGALKQPYFPAASQHAANAMAASASAASLTPAFAASHSQPALIFSAAPPAVSMDAYATLPVKPNFPAASFPPKPSFPQAAAIANGNSVRMS